MKSPEAQLQQMMEQLKARSKTEVILESGFFALILSILFVGNFTTLLIMVLNRRMRTIPNMLVVSLAVSDFGLGALCSGPLGLLAIATSDWPFNDATCQYQGYIAITMAVASTQTLTIMAVNRYFRIVNQRKYRRFFTKKKTTIIIIVSWLYSLFTPLPYVLSGHKMIFHPSKFFCYLQVNSGPFTAFLVTVNVGIPSNVIFYCYLKIFKSVGKHSNNFQSSRDGTSRAVKVKDIKIARTLFAIVIFFTLCWTPVLLIDVVDTIRGRWGFPREAYLAYSFLITISSALNPVIYGVMNKNFQKEYLKILRCSHCRTQVAVEPFSVEGRSRTTTFSENSLRVRKKENLNEERM